MHNINPTPQVTESLQFASALGIVVKEWRGGGVGSVSRRNSAVVLMSRCSAVYSETSLQLKNSCK